MACLAPLISVIHRLSTAIVSPSSANREGFPAIP
jgi:hypothetical protein